MINNNSYISIILDSIVTKSNSFTLISEYKVKLKPCNTPKINSTLKDIMKDALIRLFYSSTLDLYYIRLDDKLKKIYDSGLLSKMMMSFIYNIVKSIPLDKYEIYLYKIEDAKKYFKSEDDDEETNSKDNEIVPSKMLTEMKEFKNNHSFSGLESFLLNVMLYDDKIVPNLNVILMDKYYKDDFRMESLNEFIKTAKLDNLGKLITGEVLKRAQNYIEVKSSSSMFL
eukprot:Mrub_09467.p1 GENE.Mrub_09467~~Mrub_09467.p1  ORF type:complete len:246 (+),score=37.19 Mrub_09467:59-739(+)